MQSPRAAIDKRAAALLCFVLSRRDGHHIPSAAPPDAGSQQPKEERGRRQTICHPQIHSFARNLDNFGRTIGCEEREKRTSLLIPFQGPSRATSENHQRGLLARPPGSLQPNGRENESTMRTIICLAMLSFPLLGIASNAEREANEFFGVSNVRQWVANGKAADGEFVSYKDETVFIRLTTGKIVPIKRDLLSDEDWIYVAKQDPSILRFFLEVGTIQVAENKANGIPRMVKVMASNDGFVRFCGEKNNYDVPYAPELFENFIWGPKERSVEVKIHDTNITTEICRKKRASGYSYGSNDDSKKFSLTLNTDWENTHQIPYDDSDDVWSLSTQYPDEASRTKFPCLYFSESEVFKLESMKVKETIEKAKNNPRLKRLLDQMETLVKTEEAQKALERRQHEQKREEEKKRRERETMERIQKEEAARNTFSFSNIEKHFDKFENSSAFRTKRNTRITREGARLGFWLWVHNQEESKQRPVLLASFSYSAEDWLFVDKITLLSGQRRVVLSYSSADTSRDVQKSNGILEIGSIVVDPEQLRPFSSVETIECRFSGEKGVIDFEFSTDQIMALKEMLQFYLIKARPTEK